MKTLITTVLLALPTLLSADEYTLGDLVIDRPVAFETAATANSGAGYLTVTNNGDTDDRMVLIEADFPRVMLHETKVEDDVARMIHLNAIDIPAGDTVVFQPGGKHVMFMGLNGDPFEVGEEINARLVFENAGEIDVVFMVEARDQEAHDHSDDHSAHEGHDTEDAAAHDGHSGHKDH